MTLHVNFHPLAVDDVHSAWRWYERQEPGLGERFIIAYNTALDQIPKWPDSGQPAYANDDDPLRYRRVPLPGFPYAIRYRVNDQVLYVMVVYHQSRTDEDLIERHWAAESERRAEQVRTGEATPTTWEHAVDRIDRLRSAPPA